MRQGVSSFQLHFVVCIPRTTQVINALQVKLFFNANVTNQVHLPQASSLVSWPELVKLLFSIHSTCAWANMVQDVLYAPKGKHSNLIGGTSILQGQKAAVM